MFRFLVALCALAIFSAAVHADRDENEVVVENQAGFVKKLVQGAITGWFVGGSRNCINQAAQTCEPNWGDTGKLYNCAKDYFTTNQARCAFGINSSG